MTGLLAACVGSVIEAWTELRVHRTRVLLSLIGVAVAVCSLTSVVALGDIAQQATIESSERSNGRPAALSLSLQSQDDQPTDDALVQTAWTEALTRYDVTFASRIIPRQVDVQFVDGVAAVTSTMVDPAYGAMHRVSPEHGRWFTATDINRLAPAVIIDERLWARLGSPDLALNPTISLFGVNPVTAVVVGIVKSPPYNLEPTMFMLNAAYSRIESTLQAATVQPAHPAYELWVPPENAADLMTHLQSDFTATLGEGTIVSVNRQDYAAYGQDPNLSLKLLVSGVSVLLLLLGALGLLNISLVTIRQRIQEIGIRRSFGATAARVFFAVMMESVVATVAAGIVGVMLSMLLVKSPWATDLVSQGATDLPPFPLEAAVLGLGIATLVGALAGLLPALVAVRVKVIDAIRY
ncbi:ABC transporter permease [Cryobacterium algoricola]|uniref:ABC transporter permease n=2 Tax=Cryobacterium algoricola TaxID=1259183 RepID=A0ABY2IDK2_9MICO|nr:ABC transporter permease [Cryobacterium algoricola]